MATSAEPKPSFTANLDSLPPVPMSSPQPQPAEALRSLLTEWAVQQHLRLTEEVIGTLQSLGLHSAPDEALLTRILALAPANPAAPATDPGVGRELGVALDLLEAAGSQGEALHKLLDGLEPLAERSALFVVKQGIATLFDWRGFEGSPVKAGSPVVPPPDLEALLQGRQPWLGLGPAYKALIAPLSRMEAPEARLFPLRLKRKAVAVLLVDCGLRQQLDHPEVLRALAQAASAALGALAGAKEEEKAPPVADRPTLPTMLVQDPIPEPSAPAMDPKVKATAERFARVLAGDIELYFPTKVAQARTQGDLYGLLREELDRSRQSFVDRFGEELEQQQRIFLRAVVDLLCDGEAGRLGPAPWA